MNTIFQNILVFTTVFLAVVFLARKFFFKKTKNKNACGDNNDCECH